MQQKLIYLTVIGFFAGASSLLWGASVIGALFYLGDIGGTVLVLLVPLSLLALASGMTMLLLRAFEVSWWRGAVAACSAHILVLLLCLPFDILSPFSLILICILSLVLSLLRRHWLGRKQFLWWVSTAVVLMILAWNPASYAYNPAILPGLAAWTILPALLWISLAKQQPSPPQH